MKLETNVVQTLKQKQKLSQNQQHALKILAMNDMQLQRELQQASQENPLLEIDEYIYGNTNDTDVYEYAVNVVSQPQSLQDVLLEQLQVCMEDIPFDLGEYLIESLDSNGYLLSTTKELKQQCSYDEEVIEESLAILQGFEPIGVFARNLQECLLIQLCYEDIPYSQVAILIVNFYMKELACNQMKKISESLQISLDEVCKAVDLIRSLSPKPGSSYANKASIQNPDAIISLIDGEIHIKMPSYPKSVSINTTYANSDNEVVMAYVRKHMQQAQIFIDSLQKRNMTLSAILMYICEHQKDYFLHQGELKPLTLHDIATHLQLHESTISRGLSQKFIEFENRHIPLKTFFPARLDSGESSSAIHDRIKQIIMNENQQKPLSDQQITKQLEAQNIKISRRTITKYREQMKIPAASQRKTYEEDKHEGRD